MSNHKIFQIYYDESQKSELFLDSIPYYNEDLDQYFENSIIAEIYNGGLFDAGFCGVLSWKLRKKNGIKAKSLEALLDFNHDCYSFTYDRHDVLGYAEYCHPGFLKLFKHLLAHLGIKTSVRPLVGIYQNAIITREEIYSDYVEHMLMPAIQYLENCPEEIRMELSKDSQYRQVSIQILNESFGQDYCTYHTFILERLWSVYYHLHRKKLNIDFVKKYLGLYDYRSEPVNSKGRVHAFNL